MHPQTEQLHCLIREHPTGVIDFSLLLDSWFRASNSYAPSQVCEAIYGNITGAQLDPESGLWLIPCNTEIDLAVQIK